MKAKWMLEHFLLKPFNSQLKTLGLWYKPAYEGSWAGLEWAQCPSSVLLQAFLACLWLGEFHLLTVLKNSWKSTKNDSVRLLPLWINLMSILIPKIPNAYTWWHYHKVHAKTHADHRKPWFGPLINGFKQFLCSHKHAVSSCWLQNERFCIK